MFEVYDVANNNPVQAFQKPELAFATVVLQARLQGHKALKLEFGAKNGEVLVGALNSKDWLFGVKERESRQGLRPGQERGGRVGKPSSTGWERHDHFKGALPLELPSTDKTEGVYNGRLRRGWKVYHLDAEGKILQFADLENHLMDLQKTGVKVIHDVGLRMAEHVGSKKPELDGLNHSVIGVWANKAFTAHRARRW